jgi:uncharacterized protein (TIGR00251 family)
MATFIQVKVKPGARASKLTPVPDGIWQADLKAAPVEGQANDELVRLLARHFGVPRTGVVIKSGASARLKLVKIDAG